MSTEKARTTQPKAVSVPTEELAAEQKEKVELLPLSKLAAFENHPFRITQNEDFHKLVESIKENGVLIPAIARRKSDGYELIAGHRRKLADRWAGYHAGFGSGDDQRAGHYFDGGLECAAGKRAAQRKSVCL